MIFERVGVPSVGSGRMEEIEKCTRCELCVDVCPIYEATGKEAFSPLARINAAKRIFEGGSAPPEMVEAIYNCPECGRCEVACPSVVNVTSIVETARAELVRRGVAPLEGHKRIVSWILELGNSVGGDPEKRLEWLSEEFEEGESSTLLYFGCLPSYLVKESAKSTYLALKRAGVDFMILRNEGCCGVYLYDAGLRDLAEKVFRQNAERFGKLGIERIITPCAGCYRCFKRYYPKVIGEKFEVEVRHVVEVLDELMRKGRMKLEKKEMEVTYHDPCRLGRKEGLYEAPRRILERCGVKIREMSESRENGMCCGAGAGIRSLYKELSMEVAAKVLRAAPSETLVTSCPFCVFNFKYAARKGGIKKDTKYITELL